MRRAVLGALAAASALGALAFSGPAQAQCWWTGFGYSCTAAPMGVYQDQSWGWWSPYPAYQSYTGYYDQVPFGNNPYKPDWLPSYPGVKPSSGAGR